MIPRRTLLRAGPAALAAPAILSIAAIPAVMRPSDITALVKMHRANFDAFNVSDEQDRVADAQREAAYLGTREALLDIEPATLPGVLAKAEMARFETDDDQVMRSVVADLLRLGGAA